MASFPGLFSQEIDMARNMQTIGEALSLDQYDDPEEALDLLRLTAQ